MDLLNWLSLVIQSVSVANELQIIDTSCRATLLTRLKLKAKLSTLLYYNDVVCILKYSGFDQLNQFSALGDQD